MSAPNLRADTSPILDPYPDHIVPDKIVYLKTISQGKAATLSNARDLETNMDDLSAALSGVEVPSPADQRILAVADQMGKLWLVNLSSPSHERTLLLDLAARPEVHFVNDLKATYDERGFWGIAFDPNFAKNGYFYTYNSDYYCIPLPAPNASQCDLNKFTPIPATFTLPTETLYTPFNLPIHPDHQSVLRKWYVDPAKLMSQGPTFVQEIIRIDKPQSNHNAGVIKFGKDGMLYLSVADGGNSSDYGPGHLPPGENGIGGGNAQNLHVIYGKLLRIDPNPDLEKISGKEVLSSNGNYAIPKDNPFFSEGSIIGGQEGCDDMSGAGCSEIYAYGFRNPYSMAFDEVKNLLFVGDVGQDRLEEVDVISEGGGNYGWRVKEGSFCFAIGYPFPVPPLFSIPGGYPSTTSPWVNDPSLCVGDYIDPVADYDHDEGISVIGGYVYRGESNAAMDHLKGHYIFGDYKRGGFTAFLDGRLFYLTKADVGPFDKSEIKELQIVDDVPRPVFFTNPDSSGNRLSLEAKLLIFGFASDRDGKIYVLGKYATKASPGGGFPNLGPKGDLGFIKEIVKVEDLK